MKLFKLLKGIRCRVLGSMILDIGGLYHNDKDVKENGLFFCLNGLNFNGSDFVESAIKNGAIAIVVENEIRNLRNVTQILVKDVRKTMSLIAKNFYGKFTKLCRINP